ncbi:hypothetical protein AB0912_15455 [Streptomyces sp. NPDC007084]|uniref:hypothetical protein n=1 Tax=Streptomyces sp. NPDC007084 TaxID=3154313 RepID=UPI003455F739
MTMGITLNCNQQWAHGTCATSLITGTSNPDEARAAAQRQGWRTHPDGQDYCPGHSGRPPLIDANVVPLRPGQEPASTPQAGGSSTAASTVREAAELLRRLADTTTAELRADGSWHLHHVSRERWFMEGVSNAVPGPAGQLAGLLAPESARFVANLLDRTVTPGDEGIAPIPAEAFLLANNIVRSLRR